MAFIVQNREFTLTFDVAAAPLHSFISEWLVNGKTVRHTLLYSEPVDEDETGRKYFRDTLSFAENLDAGLSRNPSLRIAPVDAKGRRGAWQNYQASNPQVGKCTVQATGTPSGINIVVSGPQGVTDIAEYFYSVSTSPQPNPNLTGALSSTSPVLPVEVLDDGVRYIRVAARDSFGQDSLVWSDEVQASRVVIDVDAEVQAILQPALQLRDDAIALANTLIEQGADNLAQAIASARDDLSAADANLQTNINTANSTRASAVTTLQNNINAANTARTNADNALTTQVNTKVATTLFNTEVARIDGAVNTQTQRVDSLNTTLGSTATTGIRGEVASLKTLTSGPTFAKASDLNVVKAQIDDPETGLSAQLGTLETALSDLETGKAEASRVSALETTVNAGPNRNSQLASRIVTVETATTDGRFATASRVSTLEAEADTIDGRVTATNNRLDTVEVKANGAATSTQLNNLQSSVNVRNRTFRQNTAPSNPQGGYPLITNDVWMDADDNHRIHQWSGTAWVASHDLRGEAALAELVAARAGQTNLTAKLTQMSQATSNGLEGKVAVSVFNELEGRVETSESDISATNTRLDTVEVKANEAATASSLSTLQGELNTERGRITANKTLLDTVKVTADGAATASRVDALEAETETVDGRVTATNTRLDSVEIKANAAATSTQLNTLTSSVNVRNRSFRQNTAPINPIGGYPLLVNDVWMDADDNHQLYTWSGTTWVASHDLRGEAALAELVAARAGQTNLTARLAQLNNTLVDAINGKVEVGTFEELEARIDAPVGGLANAVGRLSTLETVTSNGTFTKAQSTKSLEALSGSPRVHPQASYDFHENTQGWTASLGTLTFERVGQLEMIATSAGSYIQTPAIAINGREFGIVQFEVENVGTVPLNELRLYYSIPGRNYTNSFYNNPVDGAHIQPGETRQLVFDMRQQTVGGLDWISQSVINRIRFDAAESVSTKFRINGFTVRGVDGGQVEARLKTVETATTNGSFATASRVGELEARVTVRPNLLRNGGFEEGLLGISPNTASIQASDWGTYLNLPVSSAGAVVTWPRFPCRAGRTYTISGDTVVFADAGNAYFDILWYNSAGTQIGDSIQTVVSGQHDFSNAAARRQDHATSVVAPTGAVEGLARCVINALTNPTALAVRQVKVELGGLPATAYTAERTDTAINARLTLAETATTDGRFAAVSRVSALETTINTPTTGLLAKVGSHETAITDGRFAAASRVQTLESKIDTPTTGLLAKVGSHETAITDGRFAEATRVSNLEALTRNTLPNLINNGGFTSPLLGTWEAEGNKPFSIEYDADIGSYCTFATADYITSIPVPARPNAEYSLSFDGEAPAAGAHAYIQFLPSFVGGAGTNFAPRTWGTRKKSSAPAVAPAGTTSMRVVLDRAGGAYLNVSRVKINLGAIAADWSDDRTEVSTEARVRTVETATTDGRFATASRVATLEASSSTRANILVNGGFEDGLTGISVSGGGMIADTDWGRMLRLNLDASTVRSVSWPWVGVTAGRGYVVSGDTVLFGSGRCYFDIIFQNNAGTVLLDSNQTDVVGQHDFSNLPQRRQDHATYAVAPAGATRATVRCIFSDLSNVSAMCVRQVKLELGGLPATPYSSEATAVQTTSRVSTIEQVATSDRSAAASAVTVLEAKLSAAGGNLLANTDFESGFQSWGAGTNQGATFAKNQSGTDWMAGDENNLGMYQNGTGGTYADWTSALVAVEPGKTYEWSPTVASHRANLNIFFEFLNTSNGNVSYSPIDAIPPVSGGQSLGNWRRAFCKATAPSGAVKARVYFRKTQTLSGNTDSYAWMMRPFFAECSPNAVAPAPFAHGSSRNLSAVITEARGVAVDALGKANATFGITSNVNGKITGFGSTNTGNYSTFDVVADRFRISDGSSGIAPFEVVGGQVRIKDANIGTLNVGKLGDGTVNAQINMGSGKIVSDSGSFMKVSGSGFGTQNQFLEWAGPKMPFNQCSEANGIYFITNTGGAYFGGSLSAGVLTTKAGTSDMGTNAIAETNAFGSNGGTIRINLSYTAGSSFSETDFTPPFPANSYSSNTNTAQVKLYRSINGGAYTEVATLNASGQNTVTGENGGDFYQTTYQSGCAGSITFTDPSNNTQQRRYKAQLVSRAVGFYQNAGASQTQNISIICVEE